MDKQNWSQVFQKPMHLASLDLGSNSFHLLIGVIENGHLKIIYRQRKVVRLSSGIEHGVVNAKMKEKALFAIELFNDMLSVYQPEYLKVVGTAAFRLLSEQETLKQDMEQILQAPIDIISGEEEAQLIYEGVVRVLPKDTRKQNLCVLDIGGGSTECVIGFGTQIQHSVSLPLGCLALQQRFFPDGKMTEKAYQALKHFCQKEIIAHAATFHQYHWETSFITVGIANPVKNIAEAIGYQSEITQDLIEKIIEHCIEVEQIDALVLPGLQEDRKQIFLSAVVILQSLLEAFDISKLQVANTALREGLLFNLLKNISLKTAV